MEIEYSIYDTSNNSNDTIFDQFLYEIDRAVETGNLDIIKHAVNKYRPHLSKNYIKMAESMYFTLLEEKVDAMSI